MDDEKIIADTMKLILESSGHIADAAYSGEMAVRIASKFEPELLLSDVVTDGMNGIETAIRIQEMFPNCAVNPGFRPACGRGIGGTGSNERSFL